MSERKDIVLVERKSNYTWVLTRVTELFDGANEYETIGRVVGENGMFYAELICWLETGHTYYRHDHAYSLMRGALKKIIDYVPPMKS